MSSSASSQGLPPQQDTVPVAVDHPIHAAQEVIAAAREYRLPSTDQLTSVIERVETSDALQQAKHTSVSQTGRKIIQDTEKLLETTKRVLEEKNTGNHLQNIVFHSHIASQQLHDPVANVSGQLGHDVKNDLKTGASDITTLARLIVGSSEFRHLLKELYTILYDIITDPELKEQTKSVWTGEAPDEQVIKEAQENQRTVVDDSDVSSDPRASLTPSTDANARRSIEEDDDAASVRTLKSEPIGEGKFRARKEAKSMEQEALGDDKKEDLKSNINSAVDKGQGAAQAAAEPLAEVGAQLKSTAKQALDPNQSSPNVDEGTAANVSENVQQSAQVAGQQVADTATDKLGLDRSKVENEGMVSAVKQKAAESKEDLAQKGDQLAESVQRVTERHFHEDQVNHLLDRLKKVVLEIQANSQYQSAIHHLLQLSSQIRSRSASAVESVTGSVTSGEPTTTTSSSSSVAASDASSLALDHIIEAELHAKMLVENFAGGYSLNPLFEALYTLVERLELDQPFRHYMVELKHYLVNVLLNHEFIESDTYREQGRSLLNQGHKLMSEGYADLWERIANELGQVLEAVMQDQLLQRMASEWSELAADLFLDERGNPTVKPELLGDVRKIMPIIAEKLKFIPIGRIEHSDEDYDYVFDNLVVKAPTILPQYVRVDSTTRYDAAVDAAPRTILLFTISRIQAMADNISFWYRKKRGFPKLSDRGLANFHIDRNGMTVHLEIEPTLATDTQQTFIVRKIHTIVDHLDLEIRETKRDYMYSLLSPFIKSMARDKLEETICQFLADGLFALDKQITRISAMASQQVQSLRHRTIEPALGRITGAGTPVDQRAAAITTTTTTTTTATTPASSTGPIPVLEETRPVVSERDTAVVEPSVPSEKQIGLLVPKEEVLKVEE